MNTGEKIDYMIQCLQVAKAEYEYTADYVANQPTEQLIAHTHTQEEIRQLIGADSLGYMEIEKLKDMVGDLKYCDACFTGKYPMEVPEEDISQAFEQN